MSKKRTLTEDQSKYMCYEEYMLKGDIKRMCDTDDVNELIKAYHCANTRIDTIFHININKFINKEGE